MDLESRYQKVIEEISKGHRALMRFSHAELEDLEKLLHQNRLSPSTDLDKVLCLIEHSASLHSAFEADLIELLKQDLPDSALVFTLNCARKHIIQARGQKGHRLTFEFLEALKKLLYSRSPEVVEWTLRTIEECGSQGVYFLKEFDNIKPPPWKWFNEHQRAVREIITLLERRWGPSEKPKS